MDLKSRLSRLQQHTSAPAPPAASPGVHTELRQRLAQLHPRRVRVAPAVSRRRLSPEALAIALDGETLTDGLIRIRRRVPLDGRLGRVELRSLHHTPELPGETGHTGRRHVYLDTETTGLAGGSGTLAFLVGVVWLDDDALTLTQFLLTRFAAEAALLEAFADTLVTNDRLVSYNGKSYDLPLLLTRFRMQARSHALEAHPHLDLLHPVRRLFGSRWRDCRLTTLERELLGFSRVDDLPGSEAPAAWFDYVRGGEAAQLMRVVEHNRQDIISLAAAHHALARAITQPLACGVDLPALARWLGGYDEAAARGLLERHVDSLGNDGRRLLGHYCRRAGDWTRAAAIWEALAAGGCTDSMERLAKYHEHISRDLVAASKYCESLPAGAAQEHRRRRIARKIKQQMPLDCVRNPEDSRPDP
jgi:uncharacterized protein YprB with RNaseH-like and TPR domain